MGNRSTGQLVVLLTVAPFIVGCYLSAVISGHYGKGNVLVDFLRDMVGLPLPAVPSGSKDEFGRTPHSHLPPSVTPKEVAGDDGIRVEGTDDGVADDDDPFEGVRLVIHRNGEAEACGHSGDDTSVVSKVLRDVAADLDPPVDQMDKYEFDAYLTTSVSALLPAHDDDDDDDDLDVAITTGTETETEPCVAADLPAFCDMGEDHTTVLPDHDRLVRAILYPYGNGEEDSDDDDDDDDDSFLSCHFHTREGLRVTSFSMLADLAREARRRREGRTCPVDGGGGDRGDTCREDDGGKAPYAELHLYAVQAGRTFIFAPSYVGETFDLSHVRSPRDKPISLEVISLSPRVFDVKNFFSVDEASAIVDKALTETSETHRMKRSSTGASGYNLNNKRTSENAFDTHSKMAMVVKKRCFEVLGFDEYVESMADGLQVLRYNKTTAYTSHLDWIEDEHKQEEHNYDSAGVGTNRFATILLYMSDLPDGGGGETVFTKGWPGEQKEEDRVDFGTALDQVRKEGVVDMLKTDSWEEKMVAQCRSRLAVKPASAKAVLFYSQNPDGTPDGNSLHGGCPVLEGEKWAANLWVWNGPRGGYDGAPMNQEVVERNKAKNGGKETVPSGYQQLSATFQNSGADPRYENAELYFQETFWGKLGHGDEPLNVNTFEGHQWYVRVNGEVVKEWVIDNKPKQVFTL